MYLRIKAVEIENFMSIGRAKLEFDSLGTTLLSGINQSESLSESNGSGKSSLVESIIWALTGSTSRNSDTVVNLFSGGPYAEVIIEFDLDDKSYRVTRRSNNYLHVERDGEDISGSTTTKTKKILSEILGVLDYDTLTSIVVISQGMNSRLSILSPSARKTRLEKLSGSDLLIEQIKMILSVASKKISDKIAEIDSNIKLVEGQSMSLTLQVNKIKSLIESSKTLNITKSQYDQLLIDKASTENTYKEINEELIRTRSELSSRQRRINELNSRVDDLTIQKSKIMAFAQSVESGICPTCHRPLDENHKVEVNYDELKSIKSQLAQLFGELDELQSTTQKDPQQLQGMLNQLSNRMNTITQMISEYERSSAVTESHESQLIDLNEQIKIKSNEQISLIDSEKPHFLSREICQWFTSATSRDLRTFLLESTVNFMNNVLEGYSRKLFNDRVIKLVTNGNSIDIKLGEQDFSQLSGGEGRRVDLALQLAQRDLARVETGLGSSVLVLDEVLDGLDAIGIQSVLKLIESQSETAETIIVITHRNDLEVPHDSEIVVTKGVDKISRISSIMSI